MGSVWTSSLVALTLAGAAFVATALITASPSDRYPQFSDVTAAAGLSGFRNKQGTPRKDYILESIGGGAAFFDYDNDGWLDILLVRGTDLENYRKRGGEAVCALYRNNRDGTFTDVTKKTGIDAARGWGMGVAIADYNDDGFDDILITGYGRNFLFRNNANGSFDEVAERAGLLSKGLWSTGATFFDSNPDGLLDVYISRYVTFDAANPVPRSASCEYKGLGVFCGPQGFESDPHSLYRNNGDGTFRDVSDAAGLRKAEGPHHGLGVIALDYDNDGRSDLYVGNDSTPNLLWHNMGNGRFVDVAVEKGVAFSADGREQASMGVEAGDLRNRGLLDLFVTNFSGQMNELYRNSAGHSFEDVTWDSGMALPAAPYLGWSAHMADFGNSGWMDVFVVNGHVYPEVDTQPAGTNYRQKPLYFRNLRNGKFASTTPGAPFEKSYTGRGAAIGDFDNDGALDILINNIDGAPVLLRNKGTPGHNWLEVLLRGRPRNRNALGARVFVRVGGAIQMREINGASGYLSSSSRRAHFGFGANGQVDEVTIIWPNGRKQLLNNVKTNQRLVIDE
ncbi:MAG: CRTAC1 family protein [Acidobacteriota bacterium]|nr:CRTAC1 family protein [Acidobacteriota bacterium]